MAPFVEANGGIIDDSSSDGSHSENHHITWVTDVIIYQGASPWLIVDAGGNIVKAINVSVNSEQTSGHVTGDISVDDIQDQGGSKVIFNAPGGGPDFITGAKPTFEFLENFQQVLITNESDKKLIINEIDVINRHLTPPKVELDSSNVSIDFLIKHDFTPTLVDIKNFGNGDILLQGSTSSPVWMDTHSLIENPIGETRILNTGGNIFSAGAWAIIRTNTLGNQFWPFLPGDFLHGIQATAASIGTGAARVNVDIVQQRRTVAVTVTVTAPFPRRAVLCQGRGQHLPEPDRAPARPGGEQLHRAHRLDRCGRKRRRAAPTQAAQETKVSGTFGGVLVTVPPNGKSGTFFQNFSGTYFNPDADPGLPLDVGVFADPNQATPIPGIFDFRGLDPQQNRTVPGLVAGGNIIVKAANPATNDPTKLIDVIGITDLQGASPTHLDAVTSGNITLTEAAGPLRVGTVFATMGDIKLTAPDAPAPGEDVQVLDGGQISSPGGVVGPNDNTPALAPTAAPTDGGITGGSLAAGTYYAFYTFTFPNGIETPASPASLPFTVAAGNIPQVALPPLPAGVTGINLYLSNSPATSTARRYASGITTSVVTLSSAAPAGVAPPATNVPTAAPTVNPTGGNMAGVTGNLAAGTYYAFYTYTYPGGGESATSSASLPFTVAAGSIPRVTLPALPAGATGFNLYLSNSPSASTATRYATGITTLAFNLLNVAPVGGAAAPASGLPSGAPTTSPTVVATGGGAAGGTLAPGTYFVTYTAIKGGIESFPAPNSAVFTVAAGNIPQVTLPPLSRGVTSYNLYLSDATAQPGSAILYATGITTTTINLATGPPTGGLARPLANVATGVPSVNPTGGNMLGVNCNTPMAMNGTLAPGQYFVLYTLVYPSGVETFASQASATFTVHAHDIPLVTLPPPPPWATGYNVYLSDAAGDPGTATRYLSDIITPTFYLISAATGTGVPAPIYNYAPLPPSVNPIGGNAYGGSMLPGTYYVQYTFTYPNGAETSPSPASVPFTVVAGNVPQVTLPPLPAGATGINIYLSDPLAHPGSATLYAARVTTPTYNLQRNALVSQPVPPTVAYQLGTPTVNPTGGGVSEGTLAPGTYFLDYTFTFPNGVETTPSPISATFTVAAGNVPQVTLPPLPSARDRHQPLPVEPLGDAGLGGPLRLRHLRDHVQPAAARLPQLAGRADDRLHVGRRGRQRDGRRGDRRQPRAGHVFRALLLRQPRG